MMVIRHSEWRKLAKKLRRKRIRQQLASVRQQKDEEETQRREKSPTYQSWLENQKEIEEFEAKEEARLAIEQETNWLQKEVESQKHWLELQVKLRTAQLEREQQNLLIRQEWEREQERLQRIKQEKEREIEEKRQRQQEIEREIDDFLENGGNTPEYLKDNYELNPNKQVCPFYQKTATCRFGDKCSRNHIKPGISRTLLILNFYSHYSLEPNENEYKNSDASLEFENDEIYENFREFFFDVLPEMEHCGRVTQFKVCCNKEAHLRGNVYVEYSTTRDALKSYRIFNGRWYGGKQLNVQFCLIDSWKAAICGLHSKRKCPKGSGACNFLHVFNNPNNLFRHLRHNTPERSVENRSNWRWSESPERILPQQKRNGRRNGCERKAKKSRRRSRSRSRHKRRKSNRSSTK